MKENETKTQSKGLQVLKAILNAVINIMIVIVLITSIVIAAMALTSRASGISTILGYTIQPIESNSMKGGSPDGYGGKDFEHGDLMIAKATNFDPNAEYDLGDIITFVTEDVDGNQALVSHRIVDAVTREDGKVVYQTWGDNREMSTVPDQEELKDYLHASQIASVYYTKDYEGKIIKGLGAPLDYLKTQMGFFLVVLLPMVIFFMYELVRVVLNATSYKKSVVDEEKENAVKEAVAEALAANGVDTKADSSGISAEEMEQFRQFQEFQKMQKAQQDQPAQPNNEE